MKLKFEKYESGGNDFILLDNRKSEYHLTSNEIKKFSIEILESDQMD